MVRNRFRLVASHQTFSSFRVSYEKVELPDVTVFALVTLKVRPQPTGRKCDSAGKGLSTLDEPLQILHCFKSTEFFGLTFEKWAARHCDGDTPKVCSSLKFIGFFEGSGGGIRTPDTRIMIPLL